ncbi:MAG: hypothetical protein M3162_01995 [Thermoproteota archaeon]|nr:hypothetical protein [Thermoproteota archaeon]
MDLPANAKVSGEVKMAYSPNEALDTILKVISNTRETLECIIDSEWVCRLVEKTNIINFIAKLRLHNTSSRFIVNVTNYNMNYCKRIMKYAEIRHAENVLGCSGISDGCHFFNYLQSTEDKDVHGEQTYLLYINNKYFIKGQKNLFDTLWEYSVPARERITEIERQVVEGIIKHIETNENNRNRKDTLQTLYRIIESSIDQILILIPNVNSFWEVYNEGLLKPISEAVERDVSVKLLIHISAEDEEHKDQIRQKLKEEGQEIEINTNFFSKELPQKHCLFVIDEAISALIENSDDPSIRKTKETSLVATFSRNISQISSSVSLFDILWIEADFEKQKKIKQMYFQMFKGLKLKDEVYKRKWAFEQDKNEKE